MQRPNAWTLGDRAAITESGREIRVTIVGFPGQLVEIEHPDGRRTRRPHTGIHPVLTSSYPLK